MSKKSLQVAVISALSAFAIAPTFAHAAVINTASVGFNVNKSVSDPWSIPGATKQTDVALGTVKLSQFDASKGVLTGVAVNLDSTHKQTTTVNAQSVTPGGTNRTGTVTGTGTSTVKVVVPSSVSGGSSTLTQTDSCTKNSEKTGCSSSGQFKSVKDTVAIGSNSLNDYVGKGTIDAKLVASELSAQTTASNFSGAATTTSRVDWSGTLGVTYTYLSHAAQAFNGTAGLNELTLDFGSVTEGDTVASQGFSLSNLLGERVALSLTGFSESGDDNNLFSTDLALFDDLGAGKSNNFLASFLANSVGTFNASYTLNFADYAPLAASSTLGSGYSLTLNLRGTVVAKEAPPAGGQVPEPASLMLMGLGASALAISRKRRKS